MSSADASEGLIAGSPAPAQTRAPVRWWMLLAPIGALAAVVLLMILLRVATGITVKPAYGHDLLGTFLASQRGMFLFVQLFMALMYAAMLAALWWTVRGFKGGAAYFAPVRHNTVVWAVVIGLALAFVLNGVNSVLVDNHIVAFRPTAAEIAIQPHGAAQLMLALIVVAGIAPLVEEFYFRGLLLRWLRQRMALSAALVIDAAVFALLHGFLFRHGGAEGWVMTAIVGSVGAVNVLWVARTRSLWPAVTTHATYNGTLVLMSFLMR